MTREARFFWGGVAAGTALGVFLTTGLVLCALLVRYCTSRWPGHEPRGSLSRQFEGKAALDFEIKDVNPNSETFGQELTLAGIATGENVVLTFMASWCGPCRQELPILQEIHASGLARPICLAAAEYGDSEDLVSLVKDLELSLPVLYADPDQAKALFEYYTHSGVPCSYLIDSNGVIRRVLLGYRTREALLREIEEAFAGEVDSVADGTAPQVVQTDPAS